MGWTAIIGAAVEVSRAAWRRAAWPVLLLSGALVVVRPPWPPAVAAAQSGNSKAASSAHPAGLPSRLGAAVGRVAVQVPTGQVDDEVPVAGPPPKKAPAGTGKPHDGQDARGSRPASPSRPSSRPSGEASSDGSAPSTVPSPASGSVGGKVRMKKAPSPAAAPAAASDPGACTPQREGMTACFANKLCRCGFAPPDKGRGLPARWRWDCGILRPACRLPPAETGAVPSDGAQIPLPVIIDVDTEHPRTPREPSRSPPPHPR